MTRCPRCRAPLEPPGLGHRAPMLGEFLAAWPQPAAERDAEGGA